MTKTRSVLSRTSFIVVFIGIFYLVTLFLTLQALNQYSQGSEDANRMRTYADEIRYYDQVLTLESLLAAESGQALHIETYHQTLAKLDRAFENVVVLDNAYQSYIQSITDANTQLVLLESKAFDYSMAGRFDLARSVILSETYTSYKQVYQLELDKFVDELDANQKQLYIVLKNNLYFNLWMIFLFLSLMVVSLIFIYRNINTRVKLERRYTEISNRLLSIEEHETNGEYQWILDLLVQQYRVDFSYLVQTRSQKIENIWISNHNPAKLQLERFSEYIQTHPLKCDHIEWLSILSMDKSNRIQAKGLNVHNYLRLAIFFDTDQTLELGLISLHHDHRYTSDHYREIFAILNQLKLSIHQVLYKENLYRLATIDMLTGIYNRRSFMERLDTELIRQHRYQQALSMMMLDLDFFKRVNDQFGHAAGDLVLQDFTQKAKSCLRDIDLFGRVGGEEFVILLPSTDIEGAKVVAERIRILIESGYVQLEHNHYRYTVSIGVSQMVDGDTAKTFINRIDQAMYAAKNAGRNTVVVL